MIQEGGFPFNKEDKENEDHEPLEHIGKDDFPEDEAIRQNAIDLFFDDSEKMERVLWLMNENIDWCISAADNFRKLIDEHVKELGVKDYTFIKNSLERLGEQMQNFRTKIQRKAYRDKEDLANTLDQLDNANKRLHRFRERLHPILKDETIALFENYATMLDKTWKELYKIIEPSNSQAN